MIDWKPKGGSQEIKIKKVRPSFRLAQKDLKYQNFENCFSNGNRKVILKYKLQSDDLKVGTLKETEVFKLIQNRMEIAKWKSQI